MNCVGGTRNDASICESNGTATKQKMMTVRPKPTHSWTLTMENQVTMRLIISRIFLFLRRL